MRKRTKDHESYADDGHPIGGAKAGGARPTQAMIEEAVRLARLRHERSTTGQIFNDPPRGYSALDKRGMRG